jgi:hypothetical protein
VAVLVGVIVLVGVDVAVFVGVGDLKSRACWVCCAARVSAAWVKAAPTGGDVGAMVGWLETAGRHAPMNKTASPIASMMIPVFNFIAILLNATGK